jgi:membrane protein YdbS with pleckstrin-like domain
MEGTLAGEEWPGPEPAEHQPGGRELSYPGLVPTLQVARPPAEAADPPAEEELLFDLRPSLLALFARGTWALGLISFAAYLAVSFAPPELSGLVITCSAVFLLLMGLGALAYGLLHRANTRYQLTASHLILRTGIANPGRAAVSLEEIRAVGCHRGPLQRLMALSDAIILVSGRRVPIRLHDLSDCDQHSALIRRLAEES